MGDRGPHGTATDGVSEQQPPMPRWVKYLFLAVLAVVALAVLVMLVSNSEHGPGRHGAAGLMGSASGDFTAMGHP